MIEKRGENGRRSTGGQGKSREMYKVGHAEKRTMDDPPSHSLSSLFTPLDAGTFSKFASCRARLLRTHFYY